MLPDIIKFEEVATLVSHSGVQFMDFGLKLDPRRESAGEFKYLANTDKMLTRLLVNQENGDLFHVIEREGAKDRIETVRESDFDVPMAASLEQLNGAWLPAPFLRFRPPGKFDQGPANWARMRLVALDEPDLDGHTHRLTLVFDTSTLPHRENTAYLCPSDSDISAGANFRLATMTIDMRWFMDQPWVKEWLEELFREANPGLDSQEMHEALEERMPLAHYLNVLSLLHRPINAEHRDPTPRVEIPDLKVIAQNENAIPVDLVLDVGNSRTCGILIEDHGQSGTGLKNNYVLELRDLVEPERVYREPFESRIEFSQTFFGKDHLSVKSGRPDAFLWPTIARVGVEAGCLAGRRRGTEGSTGLSSPKRYLWDEASYGHGWRFNSAYVRTETEPLATAAPFSHLINELGNALYAVPEEEQMPVFKPHYSRSSLMTFMLAEVLAQALMQTNSPAQRVRQGHTNRPRRVRSITLTVPPAMPQAERSLLVSRLEQTVALVWKSLGWHDDMEESNPHEAEKDGTLRVPMPKLRVDWDEASCGQLVYLYTEIKENYAGHPEEFFDALARPGKPNRERITLGTIDIGGGTTDLVITDYYLDRNGTGSSGSNVFVVPEQRFRDGFRVAGDDILLDIIQLFVLPSFEAALKQAGVASPDAMMSKLCGQEGANAQEQVLRQQLNLQVFTPLGLALLEAYEAFDPEQPSGPETLTYGERLGAQAVSDSVRRYVESALRRELGTELEFDLLDIPLTVNLLEVHRAFLKDRFNLCKTLASLCEVAFQYQCDTLLITGRPSRLPGIQAYLRKMLPLPPGRILPLQGYRTGSWYPFHRNGRINDPKSTASVGAMLCLLCAQHNLSNFFFRAAALRPYSTIRHIGLIDNNNTIPDADVTYRDIASSDDSTSIVLPENECGDTPTIEMRGPLRIGFRQLGVERWTASPLYTLTFTPEGKKELAKIEQREGRAPVLKVRLAVDERAGKGSLISDRLRVAGVETNGGASFNAKFLKLQLNTLIDAGLGDTNYWLDSGSVKRT
ncbi:virulence factor SrfB [Halomonas vilamensis]|uniref:Virulence factor SrfB n=1 Tax=Vreelandella vilamensis TaxID=531309 RepID=A0ABU1H7M1_9GAMM|nr:virulence factor SrfB [Halomonas vilamensis]MDR5900296.1 virulence factor SrfB [Halomonas vilamensis]